MTRKKKKVDFDASFGGMGDLETLEKNVGFPVTLRRLEAWVVESILVRLDSKPENLDESLCDLRNEAVGRINHYVEVVRAAAGEGIVGGDAKLSRVENLTPGSAGSLLLAKLRVRSVYAADDIEKANVNGTVCIYDDGIYRAVCDTDVARWARALAYAPDRRWRDDFRAWIWAEVMMREYRVPVDTDPDLIFCRDCILRFSTGEHMPFAPDIARRAKMSFAAPTPGAEPPEPVHVSPITGEKKTISTILREITGSDETLRSLWQVIGAAVRPCEAWDTIVVLYNEHGATGKSTCLQLLKALVGDDSWVASDLETLAGCGAHGKYGLEAADGASLIVCPDSEVNAYISRSLQLKSIVTHDAVLVEAKFERPRRTVFQSLIVCAANGLPKLRDKSDAMDSRFTVVPFEGRFARNVKGEDKSIRDVFMRAQEVLDWVAWKVLYGQPAYTCIEESPAGKLAHAQWRTENDSVLDFLGRFLPELPSKLHPDDYGLYVDGLPAAALYELYKADLKVTRSGSKPPASIDFCKQLYARVEEHPEWGWAVPHYDNGDVALVNPAKANNAIKVEYRGDRYIASTSCNYPTRREGFPLGADIPGFRPLDAHALKRGRGIVRAYPVGDDGKPTEPPEPETFTAIDHDGTPERPSAPDRRERAKSTQANPTA